MNIASSGFYDTFGIHNAILSYNKHIQFIYFDDQDSFKFTIYDKLNYIMFVLSMSEIIELVSIINNINIIDSDMIMINKGYFYIKTEYINNDELSLSITSDLAENMRSISLNSMEYNRLLEYLNLILRYYYFIKNCGDDIKQFIIDQDGNISGFIYNGHICDFNSGDEYNE